MSSVTHGNIKLQRGKQAAVSFVHLFMKQREKVTACNSYIILMGNQGVPPIVSQKRVGLLIKAR